MAKDPHIPEHWSTNTWEQKARENPLHAIMTVADYRGKTLEDLGEGAPEEFLDKGRVIYSRMIDGYLTVQEKARRLFMFDYGCGAGRVMNAVIEAGHDAKGADISPTMVEACARLVPKASAVVVGADGSVAFPDRSCDVAYSFAVVQHIKGLSTYERAFDEMMRIVKPGGLLAVQVNCEDYAAPSGPGYTVNYEEVSVHFADPGGAPIRVHEQDNWSGVYIGVDRLIRRLNERGFHVVDIFNWNPNKRRSMVFIARLGPGKNAVEPRKDPFKAANAGMYKALLKAYAKLATDRNRLKKELEALKNGAADGPAS